jgi:calcineurin-like phosphoesterase family protein
MLRHGSIAPPPGFVQCQYPFQTWRDMGKGAVNLHGHSHGKLKPLHCKFDIGVDARDFRPVQQADIVAKPPRAKQSQ